jgi:hypothetical protein
MMPDTWICHMCMKPMAIAEREQHILETHSGASIRMAFKCTDCGMGFHDTERLKQHMYEEHPTTAHDKYGNTQEFATMMNDEYLGFQPDKATPPNDPKVEKAGRGTHDLDKLKSKLATYEFTSMALLGITLVACVVMFLTWGVGTAFAGAFVAGTAFFCGRYVQSGVVIEDQIESKQAGK